MIKHHEIIIKPRKPEAAMMLIIMAMLIINLAATIYAATYEPVCVPAIVEDGSVEPKK
jgi:hypothetical protein